MREHGEVRTYDVRYVGSMSENIAVLGLLLTCIRST